MFTSVSRPHNGKRTIPTANFLKKLYIYVQNNEIGPISYTTYKNELKTDCRPKYKIKTMKLLGHLGLIDEISDRI